jgi:integrase
LTGQRRDEVGGMMWSEVDFEKAMWSLARERCKNDRPHIVPLSDQALVLLKSLPKIASEKGFVFTKDGKRPVTAFSATKKLLDETIAALNDGKPLAHWILHDIRRSVATHMADELEIDPHVIEGVLNHISGHKGGVAGIYNRAKYEKRMRKALAQWGSHVGRLVSGRPADNIVSLHNQATA